MIDEKDDFHEREQWFCRIRKCPICGKKFAISDLQMWTYKEKEKAKYYCSWTCYRAKDKSRFINWVVNN